jgi:lipoprotein-anchoring transpeptidase ErfK/SrfK
MRHMRQNWFAMGAAAVAAMVAAVPASAQAEPEDTRTLERGLIVSTPQGAIRTEVPRVQNLSLRVSLSERVLYVMGGESVVRTYPVSVGKDSHPTPRGSYSIQRMIWNPSWVPPNSAWARGRTAARPGEPGNPMGRVKIFFREPDYYLHGTGAVSSLGGAASHGCIRLRDVDAIELARLLMENAGARQDQAWYEQTIERRTVSRTVRLPQAVRVRIEA